MRIDKVSKLKIRLTADMVREKALLDQFRRILQVETLKLKGQQSVEGEAFLEVERHPNPERRAYKAGFRDGVRAVTEEKRNEIMDKRRKGELGLTEYAHALTALGPTSSAPQSCPVGLPCIVWNCKAWRDGGECGLRQRHQL